MNPGPRGPQPRALSRLGHRGTATNPSRGRFINLTVSANRKIYKLSTGEYSTGLNCGGSLAWSRTAACHAAGPGSNPGHRTILRFWKEVQSTGFCHQAALVRFMSFSEIGLLGEWRHHFSRCTELLFQKGRNKKKRRNYRTLQVLSFASASSAA